jgi:hypothetical protein
MPLSLALEAHPPVALIASSAWSPSMECQLINGSLMAVSRIWSGERSSQLGEFFINALIMGFLL